jgi:predicted metal-dependent phosphoesterase TrpH
MNPGQRIDLHVHSRHSPDSSLTLQEIVDHLGQAGLTGFALTDHNSVAGHPELREIERRYPMYRMVPGVEVSTREGHLLAFGVSELPPAKQPIADTVRWVIDHGGVPVPAHPMRWSHGIGRKWATSLDVPALETTNGHTGAIPNARAELLAARRGIGGTGGSDVHELRDIGRALTEFPESVDSVSDILDALREGRCQGTGLSLGGPARLRVALRTGLLRAARGFRSI